MADRKQLRRYRVIVALLWGITFSCTYWFSKDYSSFLGNSQVVVCLLLACTLSVPSFVHQDPGFLVIGMTSAWALPACIISLYDFPLLEYWDSHIIFVMIFGPSILGMLVLNNLVSANRVLKKGGIWVTTLSVWITYACVTIASVSLTVFSDSLFRIPSYYRGDAGGSIGLIMLPSVTFYLGVLLVVASLHSIVRFLTGRLSRNEAAPLIEEKLSTDSGE